MFCSDKETIPIPIPPHSIRSNSPAIRVHGMTMRSPLLTRVPTRSRTWPTSSARHRHAAARERDLPIAGQEERAVHREAAGAPGVGVGGVGMIVCGGMPGAVKEDDCGGQRHVCFVCVCFWSYSLLF
ncbi:hypothetical protein BDW74DRAFT_147565, partial [Aspergillus multicolor]|uniref:uncharacterized protein n=1 Tax=Aspergillus multicolor TaxID=41759 RepID=UPI003CCE3588